MITDYLAAEQLLIARLRSAVPGFHAVLGAADLDGVAEAGQTVPAAHVIYDGDALPGGDAARGGAGAAQMVAQRWMIVVAVRNVRQTLSGDGARGEAGPLISQTLAALSGWQPSPAFRPLRRVPGPRPGYNAGFGYFPLLFEAQLVTGA